MMYRFHADWPDDAAEKRHRPLRPRVIWTVMKASGILPSAALFLLLFLICSITVDICEPGVKDLADAMWFLFTVFTTIGLGDFTCATIGGRIATVVFSIYSLFFVALVTGAVVTFCGERMSHRRDGSVAAFLDKLEHLPELSHEELVELSERIKKFRY